MGDVIEVLTTATNTVEVEAAGPQGTPGVGVPTGGSALQVLRKASGTDYDTEWAAAGSGSGSVTSVALAGTGLSISGSPVTTSGTITADVSYGSTAGTACEGDDARLSDTRDPNTHAASHAAGGSDPVFDQDLNTGDNVTFNSVDALSFNATDGVNFVFFDSSGINFAPTSASNTRNDLGLGDAATANLNALPETLRIVGGSDPTKKVAFEVDGLTTATTRTLTVPDQNGTLALTAQLTDTQIFTSNGTWTKPAGAKMVHFIVIGGGSGGASGRRDNASANRCGGGGGGGGGISVGWLNEAAFGATETVTVGAGGAGGAGRVVIGNGNAGTAGGESSIGSVITTFASTGGTGGSGTSAGSGGGANNTARIYGPDGITGAGSAGRADAQPSVPSAQFLGPSGGSGGGGISAANAVFTGNVGGTLGNARTSGVILGGIFTASTAGGNGNSGGFNFTGSGGGGGSPDTSTGAGNNGGNGALYGGGGGGGSGSTDPATSGAGGNGGNGIVVITTYF